MLTKEDIEYQYAEEKEKSIRVSCQSTIVPQEKIWARKGGVREVPHPVIALKTYLVEFKKNPDVTILTAVVYMDEYIGLTEIIVDCNTSQLDINDRIFRGALVSEKELIKRYLQWCSGDE